MIYKLKYLIITEEDDRAWMDIYIDVTKITAFTIPEDDDFEAINIFFGLDIMSVKQEPHIKKYLMKEWVDRAVELV